MGLIKFDIKGVKWCAIEDMGSYYNKEYCDKCKHKWLQGCITKRLIDILNSKNNKKW